MNPMDLVTVSNAWTVLEGLAALFAVVLAIQVARASWPLPARLAICCATIGVVALWAGALGDLAERQPGMPAVANAATLCPALPSPDSSEPSAQPSPIVTEAEERDCHHGAATLESIEIARSATNVVLGRYDLLQAKGSASADDRHVALTRPDQAPSDGLAGWSISNESSRRKLLLTYCDTRSPAAGDSCLREHEGGIDLLADRLPLAVGDVLRFSPETGATEAVTILELSSTGTGSGDSIPDRVRFEIAKPGPSEKRTYTLTRSLTDFALAEDGRGELEACPSARFALEDEVVDLSRRVRALARGQREETALVHIGGKRECRRGGTAAIEVAEAPYSSVTIAYAPGVGFVFARGADLGARVIRGDATLWLGALEHPFLETFAGRPARLDSFVVGRTRYAVEDFGIDKQHVAMRIRPIVNTNRLPAFHCDPTAIDFVVQSKLAAQAFCADAKRAAEYWGNPYDARAMAKGAWSHVASLSRAPPEIVAALARKFGWPRAAAAGAGAAAVLALILWFCWKTRLVEGDVEFEPMLRWGAIAIGALAVCDYLAWKVDPQFAGVRSALLPDAPWGALALWSAAALAVATARGGGLLDSAVMLVVTMIMALGHCGLTAMSLDATDMSRLRFADDTTHAIGAAAGLIIVSSQMGPAFLAGAARLLVVGPTWLRMPIGLWGLIAALVLVLAAWLALGTEIGIAGVLQPSEIVKTLIVGFLAVAVTFALDRERERDPMAALDAPSLKAAKVRRAIVVGLPFAILITAGVALLTFEERIASATGHRDYVEMAGVGLSICALIYVIVRVRDPMWSSFLIIVAALAAILFVPVIRNDLSAFVVIGVTAVTTLFVVVVIHGAAMLSEYLDEKRLDPPPPPAAWRAPRPPRARSERLDVLLSRRAFNASKWVLRLTSRRPFELAAVLGFLGFLVIAHEGQTELSDAAMARKGWVESIGRLPEKPALRMVSWIELNARPDANEKTIAVEFVDVGLQGLDSRAQIAASDCGEWRMTPPASAPAENDGVMQAAFRTAVAPFAMLGPAVESLAQGAGCVDDALAVEGHWKRANEALLRETRALETPEIQNDFIGTWLLVALGRRGAIEVVILQCVLVGLMILVAFNTVKWTRAHVRNRPAASAAAYSVIGFALMMAAQWSISWANALVIVPVMGQPATFLSHGPSHMLLFGIPAVLATLSAPRLRSALEVLPRSDALPPVPWSRAIFYRPR